MSEKLNDAVRRYRGSDGRFARYCEQQVNDRVIAELCMRADAAEIADHFCAHPYGELKPLEWEPRYKGSSNLIAYSSFGEYLACADEWFGPDDQDGNQCESREHGKALCQADYEQRVAEMFTRIGGKE